MDKELIKDIIQWDVTNWSKALSQWQPIVENNKFENSLAIGEREGGLSLWLASNGIRVICTDYIEFSQELPLRLHKKHKVEGLVSYDRQDIIQLTYEENSFDLIVFKSVLGGLGSLESQTLAFKEIHRVLKPGGYLLFAENTSATKVHQFARKRFTSWGSRWYYPTEMDFKFLTKNFSQFEFQTRGIFSAFGRTETQRKILSFFGNLIHHITPSKWKYILIGIARK